MASVLVSAARFRSMVVNRRWDVEKLARELDTQADLVALTRADAELTMRDLELLAKRFKRPWPYLLIDEEERFPSLGQDHRTFFNQATNAPPELLAELEGALQTLSAAIELFPEERVETPLEQLSAGLSAERLGEIVRSFLHISDDEQRQQPDDYASLRMWVAALESRGVYVSQRHLGDPAIRAFSKLEENQAIVVVDTTDTPYARCFSLLHEYAHILLRSTGICDFDQQVEIERFCNQVSASALLPINLLSRELGVWFPGQDDDADDFKLRQLSERLRVSQAALLIRLQQAGWISEAAYNSMEQRRRGRRPQERDRGGTYYPPVINRAGRKFSRNVFRAMDEGVLNRADVAMLLGINEHIVPRYRGELLGHGGTT